MDWFLIGIMVGMILIFLHGVKIGMDIKEDEYKKEVQHGE